MIFFYSGSFFSNFYPTSFIVDDIIYKHVEQFIMYQKAIYFEDYETAGKIISSSEPLVCKQLGRKVKNYTDDQWARVRKDIAIKGICAKFEQNSRLRKLLLDTVRQELVEASPYDCIWGIGLSVSDPRRLQKSNWRGLNLLGQCLMEVRSKLSTSTTS